MATFSKIESIGDGSVQVTQEVTRSFTKANLQRRRKAIDAQRADAIERHDQTLLMLDKESAEIDEILKALPS